MNDNIEPTSKRFKIDEDIKECSICIEKILDNDTHITKCNHIFHTECINKWFESNNNCPYCRTELKQLQNTVQTNLNTDIYNISNNPFALYPQNYEPSGTVNPYRTSLLHSFNIRARLDDMPGLSYTH